MFLGAEAARTTVRQSVSSTVADAPIKRECARMVVPERTPLGNVSGSFFGLRIADRSSPNHNAKGDLVQKVSHVVNEVECIFATLACS